MRNAQRLVDRVRQLGAGSERVRILLNRVTDQHMIAPKQIETALGYGIQHSFPSDYKAVSTALNSGVPLALYSDRHTIFHSPREPAVIEQLANARPLTQFGRAMEELGVSIIKAYSPQAKGRIERQWGVFQDRLAVELRLAGAHARRS